MDILLKGSILLYNNYFRFFGNSTDTLEIVFEAYNRIKHLEAIKNSVNLFFKEPDAIELPTVTSERDKKKLFFILEDVLASPLTVTEIIAKLNLHIDFQANKIIQRGRAHLFNKGSFPRHITDTFDSFCLEQQADTFDKKRGLVKYFCEVSMPESLDTRLKKSIFEKFCLDIQSPENSLMHSRNLESKRKNLTNFFEDPEIAELCQLMQKDAVIEVHTLVGTYKSLQNTLAETLDKNQLTHNLHACQHQLDLLSKAPQNDLARFIGIIKGIRHKLSVFNKIGINKEYQNTIQSKTHRIFTNFGLETIIFLGRVVSDSARRERETAIPEDIIRQNIEDVADMAYQYTFEKMWNCSYSYENVEQCIFGISKNIWTEVMKKRALHPGIHESIDIYFDDDKEEDSDTFRNPNNSKELTDNTSLLPDELLNIKTNNTPHPTPDKDTKQAISQENEVNDSITPKPLLTAGQMQALHQNTDSDIDKTPHPTVEMVQRSNQETDNKIIQEIIKTYSQRYKQQRESKTYINVALYYLETIGNYDLIIQMVYNGDVKKYGAARKAKESGMKKLIDLELNRAGETAEKKMKDLFESIEQNKPKTK